MSNVDAIELARCTLHQRHEDPVRRETADALARALLDLAAERDAARPYPREAELFCETHRCYFDGRATCPACASDASIATLKQALVEACEGWADKSIYAAERAAELRKLAEGA